MNTNIRKTLNTVLDQWNRMTSANIEDAEPLADHFEQSFYRFIEEIRIWYRNKDHQPANLDEALKVEEIKEIVAELPQPLILNFETELELIIERKTRFDDEKYD